MGVHIGRLMPVLSYYASSEVQDFFQRFGGLPWVRFPTGLLVFAIFTSLLSYCILFMCLFQYFLHCLTHLPMSCISLCCLRSSLLILSC